MTEDDNHMPGTAPVSDLTGTPGTGFGAMDAIPAGEPGPVHAGRSEQEPPLTRTKKRRRWPWAVFILVVVAVAVASRWNLDYYAVQPGSAQSVQKFITVPTDMAHRVSRPILLTDVEIGRVTALSYLFYELQDDTTLEPLGSVTGGTPPSELDAQGQLEMSRAEADAKTAALRRLGYSVTATHSGAVIFGTYPGTPAYSVLNVGDVVTAVNGTPTPTAFDLHSSLTHYHSGQTVSLTVRKGGTAAPAPVRVTLKTSVVVDGSGRKSTLNLGIQPQDQIDYTYPFPVTINVTNIGGPSAGLAMTLGVIDALTSGAITGGHTVAATGTMDSLGNVGDVGGVPQKTVAVERAGASIFLVPPEEYGAAMSKDRPGLKIYAVATLDQALGILAAQGGSVPSKSPGSTSSHIAAG